MKLAVVRNVHKTGNAFLAIFHRLLYKAIEQPKRILIFRTGSFGDSLCAIPAIRSIRLYFPEARIDVLTDTGHPGQRLVSIGQLLPPGTVDEIINYGGVNQLTLLQSLRRRNFDAVIQLPQYNAPLHRLIRDLVIFRVGCGIPAGFGWQWDHIPFFLKAQEAAGRSINERRRLLNLVAGYGIPPLSEKSFDLSISEGDRRVAEARLQKIARYADKPMIGIVAGAKRPQNRWPQAYFEQVCTAVSMDFNVVLLGGADDRELSGQLEILENVHSLCGELSPMQNAWVMKKCRLVLANDTGPMHLAYAVGTPLIALFSARDLPGRWFPPQEPGNVVFRKSEIPCAVCLSETCTDNVCMKKISPVEVIDAIYSLVRQ